MMHRKNILLATPVFLLNFVTNAAPIQHKELPPLVPGTLDWDYIGNSFSDFAVSPQGELVVCDDSLRQQIRFHAISGPDVPLMSTFGQRGGISAGTAGEPLPDKLMRPEGANRDAAGNLYVALRYDELSPTGGLILRSFDPAGKLRWEVACHVFSECLDAVPAADGSLTAYGFRSILKKAKDARRGD